MERVRQTALRALRTRRSGVRGLDASKTWSGYAKGTHVRRLYGLSGRYGKVSVAGLVSMSVRLRLPLTAATGA